MVPMLAALWPSAVQIWRTNAVTEVLPLVPVTATCGRRLARIEPRRGPRQRAAHVLDHDHRHAEVADADPRQIAGGASAMTATAPAATAAGA